MHRPSVSPATAMSAQESPGTETRMHGRWLLIARVGWIVLTLLILTLNVVMIPRHDALLQPHCQRGLHCFALHVTASARPSLPRVLLSHGYLPADLLSRPA